MRGAPWIHFLSMPRRGKLKTGFLDGQDGPFGDFKTSWLALWTFGSGRAEGQEPQNEYACSWHTHSGVSMGPAVASEMAS